MLRIHPSPYTVNVRLLHCLLIMLTEAEQVHSLSSSVILGIQRTIYKNFISLWNVFCHWKPYKTMYKNKVSFLSDPKTSIPVSRRNSVRNFSICCLTTFLSCQHIPVHSIVTYVVYDSAQMIQKKKRLCA